MPTDLYVSPDGSEVAAVPLPVDWRIYEGWTRLGDEDTPNRRKDDEDNDDANDTPVVPTQRRD